MIAIVSSDELGVLSLVMVMVIGLLRLTLRLLKSEHGVSIKVRVIR